MLLGITSEWGIIFVWYVLYTLDAAIAPYSNALGASYTYAFSMPAYGPAKARDAEHSTSSRALGMGESNRPRVQEGRGSYAENSFTVLPEGIVGFRLTFSS